MGTVNVRWIGGKQFVGIDSTSHSVVLATADENVGVKPSDLLVMAVASCTAVDVVEILRKKRMKLDRLEVSASAEQDADPPWTFRKIHVVYRLSGERLDPAAVERAIHLAEEKYCSVAATIRPTVEVTWEYEIASPVEE
ncbi:MAG TPA: OsmC family protein [Anaerolineaceae bacterium]|nr:OsmC family protein [Anaerolineaceae bacterium]